MRLITLTSDFGPGNIGCGAMEGVIYGICPKAKVIHWCHSVPGFDLIDGARQLEGVAKIPKGFHVGVIDPGVGTKRKGILIETKRGDFLIGPDNGLLRPAAEFLGGVVRVFELANPRYQKKPVSPVFHGRDIFAPAAAYLAMGTSPEEFGPPLDPDVLIGPPYEEARWQRDRLDCEVLHINANGSLFLNIRTEEFLGHVKLGEEVKINLGGREIILPYRKTFGEVGQGDPIILNDDFGRLELAVNQGNFALTYGVKPGEVLTIHKRR